MAQIVKLRRSGVSGQKPTNANLQLGEIALNTTDGKLFFAKSGSLGPTIEEVVTTNTINTGSINISGSIDLIGTETISGSLQISGSGFLNSHRILTDLDTGSMGLINSIQFNTSSNISVKPGELAWNNADGTLDLGMKGGNVVQQIGQEIFYEVRNETGIQIPNGTAVYANGVTAGSGRITVAPYVADGSVREVRFLGVATENITSGINGFVTHFGYVKGLDTRGTTVSSIAVGDETWAVGDILYVHPTVAGKLTKIKPQHEVTTAIIITRHQSSGVIFVRPSSAGHLEDIHDISINTGSLTNGQVLMYNNINGLWENNNNFTGSFIGDGSQLYNIPLSGVTNLTTISSSFDSRINTITGSITNIFSDIDSLQLYTGALNNFTSSFILDTQTSSMTVLSASYAVTAAFALSAGGVNAPIGTYNTLVVTTPSTTWNFQHNTGQQYPIFQVFNENGYVIIPSQIRTIDNDNAEIIFSSPQSGRVVASLGGGNGTTKEFTNSNLWVVDHDLGTDYPDVTVWDSNRNIIFPNQIESVNSNQIKIYFSSLVSGHVSVSRGGHILSGGAVEVSWDEVNNKPSGIVSGSSQISHDSTTGYVANRHIDHTTVSISPGSGLSGGGTIAATRTLTLDTGSVHFLDGVKKELNTDGVISGSLQITGLGYATTGSNAFKNNQIVTGSLTVTGNGEFGGQAFSIIHDQGTVSTTTNIDWDLSNVRTITLGASVITLTFSNPKPGATYTLIIKQDGTGNRTIGWPTIRWPGGTPPTLTSVLNSVDVVTLIYDGSVYYGAYINDLK
jgi:hypothetical protein